MQERKIILGAALIAAMAVLVYIAHLLIAFITPIVVILPDGSAISAGARGVRPQALLASNGIAVRGMDRLVPAGRRGIYELRHPKLVWFRGSDGFTRRCFTYASTVGGFLDERGIELDEYDLLEPMTAEPIPDSGEIRLVDIEVARAAMLEEIPYHVVLVPDSSLARGKERVLREGLDGLKEVVYEVVTENGCEVAREAVDERVIRPAKTQVSRIGTRRESLAKNRLVAEDVIWMEATAYDPGPESNGRFTGMPTAYGLKVGFGVVAVDPKVIPLGTELFIEGYGYAIAGDTGGAIKNMRIDLGYDTRREALRFGRREVKVYILNGDYTI